MKHTTGCAPQAGLGVRPDTLLAAGALAGPDPWAELESVIDRLARLVLHAQALAERASSIATAGSATTMTYTARTDRARRLQAAVHAGTHAIAAAIAVT